MEGGYYADVEAECQVFHICGNDGNGGLTKYSFLCPNGTIFQQQYFVCDWWFNVDCSLAEELYSLNDIVAAEQNSSSSSSYEEEEGEENYSDFSREQKPGRGRGGGRRRQQGSASEESEVLSTYDGVRRRNTRSDLS